MTRMTLYLSIAFLGILLWGCGHTEIAHRDMQLATPRVPAMAVSTAMITLSNLPQSMETHPIPPSREGLQIPLIYYSYSALFKS